MTAATSRRSTEGSESRSMRDEGAVDDRDTARRPTVAIAVASARRAASEPAAAAEAADDQREKAEPRGRRRGVGGGGGGGGGGGVPSYMRDERWEDLEAEDDPNAEVRTGILDLLPEGYGFLRTSGYLPGDKDVYVSVSQVRRFHLRKGDEVTGSVRAPKESEKYQALLKIREINGAEPEKAQKRPRFADLAPLYPDDSPDARAVR